MNKTTTSPSQEASTALVYTSSDTAKMLASNTLLSSFTFTVFTDVKARTMKRGKTDLVALARAVEQRNAPTKGRLPLISLGRYGDKKTNKGSLRHQANVRSVHGLEGDYDAGDMPPEEAAKRLSEANITALVYTSPSHGLEGKGNRWRVICPFSRPLSPEERERHVARVNGVLGGVLHRESFTLSQSFYYGGVEGREPEIYLVDGVHIDARPDLDDRAIHYRASETTEEHVTSPSGYPLVTLRDALFTIPADVDYHTWIACLAAVHHETGGSKKGLAICEAWSTCGHKWKAGEVRNKWKSFSNRDAPVTVRTLFHHAIENGWEENFDDDLDYLDNEGDEVDAEIADLLGMTVGEFLAEFGASEDKPKSTGGLVWRTPDQCRISAGTDYAVKRFINNGQVGLIYGSPGHGKSMIAPYFAYLTSQGREVFGLKTKPGPVFYVASEDPLGLERRVRALEAIHGSAPDFQLVGNVKGLFDKGARDLKELLRAVRTQKPRLVVIDTLASAFPGLEENAAESMSRVVQVAREIATAGTAVIMVHHTPHAAKNPRGHSVLNGDVDMSLLLEMDQGVGVIRGEMKKNRNDPLLNLAFTIGVTELGTDEDGDPITAGFCEELPEGDEKPGPRPSPQQQKLLAISQRMIGDGGGTVEREILKEEATKDTSIFASEDPNNRRTQFNRALGELVTKKCLVKSGDQLSLPPPPSVIGVSDDDFDDFADTETDQ